MKLLRLIFEAPRAPVSWLIKRLLLHLFLLSINVLFITLLNFILPVNYLTMILIFIALYIYGYFYFGVASIILDELIGSADSFTKPFKGEPLTRTPLIQFNNK